MNLQFPAFEFAPLIRTPSPRRFESLKGYILRVAEANGYTTPTIMLGAAGMTQGEMQSAVPPLEKLAPICNRSVAELEMLGYRKPRGSKSAKHIRFFKHQFPTYYLSIKSPKICTECIQETGFIHAFWDLTDAVACPKHEKLLIKKCPECDKPLSWFRPGVLTCSCGCDLSQYTGNQLNNAGVLGLLSFIQNQLLGQPHNYDLLKKRLGFPVQHLKTLTLQELLSIIRRFENRLLSTNVTPINTQEEYVLSKAVLALRDWPEGLYQYLDSFSDERVSTEGFGLRKQFESFCGSLFKSELPQTKIAFIKEAFLNYGKERWKQGYVPRKNGEQEKIVGIYGLSKALGVMPVTAKKLVSEGFIKGKISELHGVKRHFFDLSQQLPFSIILGKSYSVRQAAKQLGLPVSVLTILREKQHFEVHHLAKPQTAYHEQDVMAFQEKLLQVCTSQQDNFNNDVISLQEVMRMKLGSAQRKADLIIAVLEKEIPAYIGETRRIQDIIFDSISVKTFIDHNRREINGLNTVVSTAQRLHCDPKVIKSLQANNLLSGEVRRNGLFIHEASVRTFGYQFVSCAELASIHYVSSATIVKNCQRKKITITWFPRYGSTSMQPFIKRADAKKLNLN